MKDFESIDDVFNNALGNLEVNPPENSKRIIEEQSKKFNNETTKNSNEKQIVYVFAFLIFFAVCITFLNKIINKSSSTKTSNSIQNSKSKNSKKFNYINNADSLNKKEDLNSTYYSKAENPINNTSKKNALITLDKEQNTQNRNSESIKEVKTTSKTKIFISKAIGLISKQKLNSSTNNNAINVEKEELNSFSNYITSEKIGELQNDSLLIANTPKVLEATNSTISENSTNAAIEKNINTESSLNKEDVNSETLVPLLEDKSTISNFFVEPNFGVSWYKNNFTNSTIVTKKELNDSILLNNPQLNFMLNVGYAKNNYALKSGLGFVQLNEQLQYNYRSQKLQRMLVDSIVIDPITNDTTVLTNVPIDSLVNIYSKNNVQTKLSYIQIPLSLEYKYSIQKLFLIGEFGFVFNYLVGSKGNYNQFQSKTIIDYNNRKNSKLNTFYISGNVSIGVGYPISKNTSILVKVPFSYGVSSIYKGDYLINRRLNSIGLQVGCRINL